MGPVCFEFFCWKGNCKESKNPFWEGSDSFQKVDPFGRYGIEDTCLLLPRGAEDFETLKAFAAEPWRFAAPSFAREEPAPWPSFCFGSGLTPSQVTAAAGSLLQNGFGKETLGGTFQRRHWQRVIDLDIDDCQRHGAGLKFVTGWNLSLVQSLVKVSTDRVPEKQDSSEDVSSGRNKNGTTFIVKRQASQSECNNRAGMSG